MRKWGCTSCKGVAGGDLDCFCSVSCGVSWDGDGEGSVEDEWDDGDG